MTNEMRNFMWELAELMDRHGVSEMNTVEESHGWETITTGIEFTIDADYDNKPRDFCLHTVGIYMTPEDFRKEAEEGI